MGADVLDLVRERFERANGSLGRDDFIEALCDAFYAGYEAQGNADGNLRTGTPGVASPPSSPQAAQAAATLMTSGPGRQHLVKRVVSLAYKHEEAMNARRTKMRKFSACNNTQFIVACSRDR